MEVLEKKLEASLTCSVCQEIFEDPRQLPCGHSMCLGCLQNLRDHSSDAPFRCPNCRQYFGPIIGISKSFTLTNIAEEFRELRWRKGGPDSSVYCDCCPDGEKPAVKTCLKCEVSLCDEHIQDHLKRPVFADHPLVKPSSEVWKSKCPVHRDKSASYYCKKSRSHVCNLCKTESSQLNMSRMLSGIIQDRLSEHQQHVDLKFEMMKNQVRESNQSIEALRENIHSEKERTKQKADTPESPANVITIVLFCLFLLLVFYAYNFSAENQALREAQDQQNRIHRIYATIAEQLVDHPVNSFFPPVTKDEGVLILDLDTANDYIELSNDLRTAKKVRAKIGYPSILSRFHEAPQVLSAHCFGTGNHVWEVEAQGYWDIAVSFRSIKHERKSRSAFGNNPRSWSLTHNGRGGLAAYHDGKKTAISATLGSSRVAVMVDIEKGNITFASMDSKLTRLHEFQAKLAQPVCLGFGLYRVDPPSIASIVRAR